MGGQYQLDSPSDRVVANCFLYILLSQLIWLEGLVDPDGRILELLNQFRVQNISIFPQTQAAICGIAIALLPEQVVVP